MQYCQQERKGDSFLISVQLIQLQQKSLFSRFRRQKEQQYRSPRLPPFCSASIREGRLALSVGHPRRTHSRYVIGCCLIPLGICGLKNNSRRITYGIGCVRRMPSLSPLSSLEIPYSVFAAQLDNLHSSSQCFQMSRNFIIVSGFMRDKLFFLFANPRENKSEQFKTTEAIRTTI